MKSHFHFKTFLKNNNQLHLKKNAPIHPFSFVTLNSRKWWISLHFFVILFKFCINSFDIFFMQFQIDTFFHYMRWMASHLYGVAIACIYFSILMVSIFFHTSLIVLYSRSCHIHVDIYLFGWMLAIITVMLTYLLFTSFIIASSEIVVRFNSIKFVTIGLCIFFILIAAMTHFFLNPSFKWYIGTFAHLLTQSKIHHRIEFKLNVKFKNVQMNRASNTQRSIEISSMLIIVTVTETEKEHWTQRLQFSFQHWKWVENESSDKYTCIDCNVSYFFGVFYKFTSCTIFRWELVADALLQGWKQFIRRLNSVFDFFFHILCEIRRMYSV